MNPFCSTQKEDHHSNRTVKLEVSNVLVAFATLGVTVMAIYLSVFDGATRF